MRLSRPLIGGLLVLAPALVLLLPASGSAAELAAAPPIIDVTGSAPLSLLLHRVLVLAGECWFLGTLLALLAEAFGKSPNADKDFGGVVFKAIVIAFLLFFYRPIFGSVIGLTQQIAARLTPDHAVGAAWAGNAEYFAAKRDLAKDYMGEGIVGGVFFTALLSLLALVGEGIHIVLSLIASYLVVFFYIAGPLCLVASIPPTGVGARWFRHFVSVASWPIISGLLLAIVSQSGVKPDQGGSVAVVVHALLMVALAVSTPVIAAHLVGAGGAGAALLAGGAKMAGVAKVPFAAASGAYGGGGEGSGEAQRQGSGSRTARG